MTRNFSFKCAGTFCLYQVNDSLFVGKYNFTNERNLIKKKGINGDN